MIHLVTFSDESMSRAAELCVSSALRYGCDDYDHLYANSLKYHDFYKENESLLSQSRGVGYWAWKPYLIQHALQFGPNGDTVIYADAGIEFIAPVQHIIERMGHDEPQDDVWLFGNNWEHAHWCKRDTADKIYPARRSLPSPKTESGKLLELVSQWGRFGKQCQASVIFFRVSDYSRAFVAEWLKWCLHDGGRLIDDSPSVLPNHPEFREHRHDQAILTTLAYREGIPLHYWPGVYNRFLGQEFIYEKLPCYASDTYGPMFHHHRLRDHEWPSLQGVPWANLHPNHYK